MCKHAAYVLLTIIGQRKIEKSAEHKIAVGLPEHLAIVDGTADQQKKKRPHAALPGPPLQASSTGRFTFPGAAAEVVGPTGVQLNVAWAGLGILPKALLSEKWLASQEEIQRERACS